VPVTPLSLHVRINPSPPAVII